MLDPSLTHFCVSCGEPFHATNSEVVLCPSCGGPPEALPEPPIELTHAVVSPLSVGERLGVRSNWQVGGVILDTYEVKHIFTSGGMGLVYRVYHRSWNIDLVMKSPRREIIEKYGEEAFVREANTWVELGLYPHIVSCYYVRKIDDLPHVFAEFVEGGSLKDWIEDKRLYEGGKDRIMQRILDTSIQFAWGLAYAHERGLVHQDVKPDNVLITLDGIAKVTDFGLAKAKVASVMGLAGKGEQDLLVSAAGGTPAFRSPEQAHGERLSLQTDIWSWGLSILEMFAGEMFWHFGEAAGEVLESFLEGGAQIPDPPPMPDKVVDLMRQCFQRSPTKRPKDMIEISGRLMEIYQQETGLAYPHNAPKAVELRANSLNNKALSLLDLGQPERAVESWKEALKVDPHHLDATYNLGLWRWRMGELTDESFVEQMSAVANTHTTNWLPQYLLGQIHLEREDYKTALHHLKQAERLAPIEIRVQTDLENVTLHAQAIKSEVQIYEGHKARVISTSLNSDGSLALSGDADGQVRLWEAPTGRCLRIFQAQDQLYSIYLSANGRYALTGGGEGGTVKLWDVRTGNCIRQFEGHHRNLYITSVCLSDDNKWALSGSWDGTARLWEVTTGKCLQVLRGHNRAVNSVCLSADGKIALTGGYDHSLRIWELRSGRCLHILEGHVWEVNSVAVSADGRIALSISSDDLRVWDLSQGQGSQVIHLGRIVGTCGDLDSEGAHVLCGSKTGVIQFWEIRTGRCIRTWQAHTGTVNRVCFSRDGRLAFSGGDDCTMKHWLLPMVRSQVSYSLSRPRFQEELSQEATQAQELIIKGIEAINHFEFKQALNHLLRLREIPEFQRAPESLRAWNQLSHHCRRVGLRAAWLRHILDGHTKGVRDVSIRGDGKQAVSVSFDDTLRLWDLETGKCLRIIKDPGGLNKVCISADGQYAVSAGGIARIKLWELNTGVCLHVFDRLNNAIETLCLSPDNKWLLSGSHQWEGVVLLWDLQHLYPMRQFKGPDPEFCSVESVQFSPNGELVLASFSDRTMRLWEVRTGQSLKTINSLFKIKTLKFAPNDQQVLTGNEDKTLQRWDLVSGDCLSTFADNPEHINAVDVSADGLYAISGGEAIKIWDIHKEKCLTNLEGHTGSVTGVCFSLDVNLAVSASHDTTLRVWELDWDLEACEVADWSSGARPYLETFLTQHTPYAGDLPLNRNPTKDEIALAITRRGKPAWTEDDFQSLLYTLGCAGYGWLRPEGVRKKLNELAAESGKYA
jgi:WD40 repeat protein/serine/threonine protein kinase